MRFSGAIAVVAACVMLAFAGSALAQSPTEDGYGGEAGAQQVVGGAGAGGGGGGEGGAPSGPVQTSAGGGGNTGGGLPFTGVELGLIALAGAGLLGTGIAVRRMVRTSDLKA
jgi:hypothetical protein